MVVGSILGFPGCQKVKRHQWQSLRQQILVVTLKIRLAVVRESFIELRISIFFFNKSGRERFNEPLEVP